MSALLEFLRGTGPDARGRAITRIWAMSNDELERGHDFIQWLFPLETRSEAVPDAPVLAPGERAILVRDRLIRANLRRSLDRMLGFYGLAWDSERRVIGLAPNFRDQAAVWLSPGNHNLRRITRILACLVLAGEREAATALLACLSRLHRGAYRLAIGHESMARWTAVLNSRG